VVYSGGDVPGFGVTVLIQHEDGWVTVYGHLAKTEVRAETPTELNANAPEDGDTIAQDRSTTDIDRDDDDVPVEDTTLAGGESVIQTANGVPSPPPMAQAAPGQRDPGCPGYLNHIVALAMRWALRDPPGPFFFIRACRSGAGGRPAK